MSSFEAVVLAAEPAPSDGSHLFCPGAGQRRRKDVSLLNDTVSASNGQTFNRMTENKCNCQKEAVSKSWNLKF